MGIHGMPRSVWEPLNIVLWVDRREKRLSNSVGQEEMMPSRLAALPFLPRINSMFFEVLAPPLIFLVESSGILPLIQIQDARITFFKIEELIFTETNTRKLFLGMGLI